MKRLHVHLRVEDLRKSVEFYSALFGAGPAVLSKLAVQDDLATRRLVSVPLVGLDLHRALRAIWLGGPTPPPGAARDLIAHEFGGDLARDGGAEGIAVGQRGAAEIFAGGDELHFLGDDALTRIVKLGDVATGFRP